jgi:hypothetical protein
VLQVPGDYETIMEAIIATPNPGDTVLVAPGVYVENVDFAGRNVTVASYMLTTGDPAYIDSTIIDGDRWDCVVSFANYEDSRARLMGFTIRNGLQNFGGGIDCQTDVSPRLEDLLVIDNRAVYIGGGIYCTWGSTPTISRVVITRNSSDEGGGFGSAHEAHPVLEDVVIFNNTGRLGGGVFAGHSSGELTTPSLSIWRTAISNTDWTAYRRKAMPILPGRMAPSTWIPGSPADGRADTRSTANLPASMRARCSTRWVRIQF